VIDDGNRFIFSIPIFNELRKDNSLFGASREEGFMDPWKSGPKEMCLQSIHLRRQRKTGTNKLARSHNRNNPIMLRSFSSVGIWDSLNERERWGPPFLNEMKVKVKNNKKEVQPACKMQGRGNRNLI